MFNFIFAFFCLSILANLNFGLKSPTGSQQQKPMGAQSPMGSTSSLGSMGGGSTGFTMGGAGLTSPMGGGTTVGGNGGMTGSTTPTWQQSPKHQANKPQTTTAKVTQVFPSKPNYTSVIGERTDRGLKKTFGNLVILFVVLNNGLF